MRELDDFALLRAYVERGSEESFAELVARHVNKVYSVALRQTGDPGNAEEITQAVFVILARKAAHLGPRVVISGWLYQTARWTSLTFLRGAVRRREREKEVCMQTEPSETESELWAEIAPLLDTAMGSLGENDRQAVVLRFFDGKSLKDVGTALGTNEESAKKRVARALEKLRKFLAKRGANSTTAVIGQVIAANAVQAAPAELAKSASALAFAKGAAASQYTSTLVHGVIKLMAWHKVKIIGLTCAGILTVSGTALLTIHAAQAAAQTAEAASILDECRQLFAKGLRGPDLRDAVSKIMSSHGPATFVQVSKAARGELLGKVSGMTTTDGRVQIGASLVEVLRYAYDLGERFPQNRIAVPTNLMYERYDFIDTAKLGGRERLRQELSNQMGIAARHETRSNLLLIVADPSAQGLHKHNDSDSGDFKTKNATMSQLAGSLSKAFGVQITDQTGLNGGYDYTLNAPYPPTSEDLTRALSQLGLALVPAPDNEQIDFLVVQESEQRKR
jgi:uncharacterized protein (TIGR03435 family)